jgi:hypothetical protein
VNRELHRDAVPPFFTTLPYTHPPPLYVVFCSLTS